MARAVPCFDAAQRLQYESCQLFAWEMERQSPAKFLATRLQLLRYERSSLVPGFEALIPSLDRGSRGQVADPRRTEATLRLAIDLYPSLESQELHEISLGSSPQLRSRKIIPRYCAQMPQEMPRN